MLKEKHDPSEAAERAEERRADPKVRAWMKRARKLFADLPPDTWIYWQEDTLNLMALGPGGEKYTNDRGYNAGSDTAAVIASHMVPGSDCGGW